MSNVSSTGLPAVLGEPCAWASRLLHWGCGTSSTSIGECMRSGGCCPRTAACRMSRRPCTHQGTASELSVKDMLNSVENIPGIAALLLSSATPETHVRCIYDFFVRPKQPHLFLVIHNINYLLVRTPKVRSCLLLLALHLHIHLISSVDHISAPLLCPPTRLHLAVARPHHAFADRMSVTGAHGMRRHRDVTAGMAAPTGTVMSETTAQHILASVTERARKLFALMGVCQLVSLEAQDPAMGNLRQFAIPYDVLFPLVRDNFIATNNTAMRSMLGELCDHSCLACYGLWDGFTERMPGSFGEELQASESPFPRMGGRKFWYSHKHLLCTEDENDLQPQPLMGNGVNLQSHSHS
ncbi:origin recognition complex subunit 2-domain-containing protein [Mycena rebaudengoi]|nr:origin recognition complex subunit 2-domain-containing protein [Mycena rebaudengoi]